MRTIFALLGTTADERITNLIAVVLVTLLPSLIALAMLHS